MISAYGSLIIAFLIIAILFLYFLIFSKIKFFFKILIIPLVIWYSLALFYTPDKLMGWPTSEIPSQESLLIKYLISEPHKTNPGAIYFLLIVSEDDKEDKNIMKRILNPKYTFEYKVENSPRLYRIPYDRKIHQLLEQKSKDMRAQRGYMKLKFLKKKKKKFGSLKKGTQGRQNDDIDLKVRILNPQQVMKKD